MYPNIPNYSHCTNIFRNDIFIHCSLSLNIRKKIISTSEHYLSILYQVRYYKPSSLITVTFSFNSFDFLKISLICLLKCGYLKLNMLFREFFHCSLFYILTILITRLLTSFKVSFSITFQLRCIQKDLNIIPQVQAYIY